MTEILFLVYQLVQTELGHQPQGLRYRDARNVTTPSIRYKHDFSEIIFVAVLETALQLQHQLKKKKLFKKVLAENRMNLQETLCSV